MEVDCIDFKDTAYFSKIITDYLEEDQKIRPFYTYSPQMASFKDAIDNKVFLAENRSILVDELTAQYASAKIALAKAPTLEKNINTLKDSNTYTVTTGHQLCLFTGPLYFIYKIVSAIKLSEELKKKYPKHNFVPVYWMATEDHDFEEISFFNFKGKKLQWKTDQKGAVGRMNTEGISTVFDEFSSLLVDYSTNAEQLKSLFQKSYLKHQNLADATRALVHELFADYGVVILDGDSKALKQTMIPVFKEELEAEISSHLVETQSEELAKNYKVQVNPREINLFYLQDGSRNRIVKQGQQFFINDTELTFTADEMLQELENHPEKFSPNVLLRPLYQEKILPNLAYIGGGGELAYWFQLKSTFDHFNTPLPMLLLRNSAMLMDQKQQKFYQVLNISLKDLFLKEGVLLKKWVLSNSKHNLQLEEEIKDTQAIVDSLQKTILEIDASLAPHVEALGVKHIKDLEQLSEKITRIERKKETTTQNHIHHLKETLFPNGGLQERHANFSEIYLSEGSSLIKVLLNHFSIPAKAFISISL